METTTTTTEVECEPVCCVECGDENPCEDYDGLCEYCYTKKYPNLDTGIGCFCCECGDELRMYNWVAISDHLHLVHHRDQITRKEYCDGCYNRKCEAEAEELAGYMDWDDETELEFRVRVGAIKHEE